MVLLFSNPIWANIFKKHNPSELLEKGSCAWKSQSLQSVCVLPQFLAGVTTDRAGAHGQHVPCPRPFAPLLALGQLTAVWENRFHPSPTAQRINSTWI